MNELDFAFDVNSKQDFVKFVELLIQNFRNNIDKWENINIDSFLASMIAYTDDNDLDDSSWSNFAQILLGGAFYE